MNMIEQSGQKRGKKVRRFMKFQMNEEKIVEKVMNISYELK